MNVLLELTVCLLAAVAAVMLAAGLVWVLECRQWYLGRGKR